VASRPALSSASWRAPLTKAGSRNPTLLGQLTQLVATLSLLLVLLGVVGLWVQGRADRSRAEAQLVEQARTLAWLVDREFERTQDAARVLAASGVLARGDLETFSRDLRAASELLSTGLPAGTPPARVGLVGLDGYRRLDTWAADGQGADGQGGGQRGSPAALASIATGDAQVSDLIAGPRDAVPIIAVAVPVLASAPDPQGRRPVIGSIGATVPRERLLAIVSEPELVSGGIASVHDRSGAIVARSSRDAETVGMLPVPAVLDAMRGGKAAFALRGVRTLEGEPATVALARAPRSGFTVKLDIPERVLFAPIRTSLLRSAAVGAAALALALAVASLMARRIVGAFARVPGAAASAARGESAVALGLHEADELAASLASTLAERERVAADARALFETSPVGVFIADTGGRVHSANASFLAMVGRTHAGGGAWRWDEITPREWFPSDEAAMAEALASGRCTPFEKEYLRPDGTRVPVLVSFGLIDRQAGLVAAFVMDLGERKAAERALRDSEARFRALADAMPQLVWSARRDGSPDYANARWREFLEDAGASPGAQSWRDRVHPDDLRNVRARWREALRTGAPYEAECRLRRRDGAHVWVLARALPIRDAAGRVARWFGTCTDISEIVAAREVLARDKAELERLATERARELHETQSRLAQAKRVEALGQLAGGIAHDVNNVLQAVQSGAGLLLRDPEDPEEVRRLASMVVGAAQRGAAVTHRLLTFSRGGELRAAPVDAGELLGGLRDMLAHTLGANIEVRLEVPSGLPPLLADRGQLETVLVNLATNARDAMPGGGCLTLRAGLDLGEGGRVQLSVADTGLGMDEATLSRVLEPFFTTKAAGKGTGLGLAMAREFAEHSGGSLGIESGPGRGTVVTIRLPVAEAPPAAQQPPAPGASVRAGPPGRILLVDDEELVRETVAEELEAIGHTVLPVRSGAEALCLLDAGAPFDLVMSDLSMPGMDGMTLIREARRRRPGLPAILLTGMDPTEVAVEDAGGALVLLRKPIGSERLAEGVAVSLAASLGGGSPSAGTAASERYRSG
jgi:PAS domain S-box-containing protein